MADNGPMTHNGPAGMKEIEDSTISNLLFFRPNLCGLPLSPAARM